MVRPREYDADKAAEVMEKIRAGVSYRQTAMQCGVTLAMVQRIVAVYGDGEVSVGGVLRGNLLRGMRDGKRV